MFNNSRYLTRGVQADIPFELQLFMWACIDALPSKRDYFQVFELSSVNNSFQRIHHFSEQPEYSMEYLIPAKTFITAKVYVIDDGDHSTMLLADEY